MSTAVFQILVTTLLTIVLGLSAWALNRIIDQRNAEDKRFQELTEIRAKEHLDLMTEITQLKQAIWGRDGKNGHASDLRDLKKALTKIWEFLSEFDYRVRRVEEKVNIETPDQPHPRIRRRPRPDDNDTEDD